MRGRRNPNSVLVLAMNCLSISSVAMKSAITPSRSGRMVSMTSGVRAANDFAFWPTASTSRVPAMWRSATTDGSSMMMPRPHTWTSVFAVPRSIAISSEKTPATLRPMCWCLGAPVPIWARPSAYPKFPIGKRPRRPRPYPSSQGGDPTEGPPPGRAHVPGRHSKIISCPHSPPHGARQNKSAPSHNLLGPRRFLALHHQLVQRRDIGPRGGDHGVAIRPTPGHDAPVLGQTHRNLGLRVRALRDRMHLRSEEHTSELQSRL